MDTAVATRAARSLAAGVLGMVLASEVSLQGVLAADPAEACESALAQAEVAVAQARSREALWTTALDALREARRLRREADWNGCDSRANEARQLAELGRRQLEYPPERN